ncbi:D-alanyl-lipoteichoic acid biosynthesis protein DltB [Schleiferilactobacillus perolens]|jgi:membrane protein involved in D-alanine export|uniref:D-alanyl-lipoteichoic acid biosynthesis protein DltB n=1 Tax=Schleiferilactobacillus perolens TaxID=100468 RepID=UPI0023578423|nr:D-alanyl-lipoteichoic acid biosynthesis protein DltB [Schleiferilactobacillus perolens]MCI2171589.1 D-alanyl-lipoteichoic acid biosynthesis protein DltB [Schleiferilactobacillus perolens]
MINLQPYENPGYFILLMVALLPAIIIRLYGHRSHWYETVVSFIFLFLMFDGKDWHQGVALIGYTILQYAVISLYTRYRTKEKSPNKFGPFCWAVILSIAPLVVVKFTPLFNNGQSSIIGFLGISYLTFKSVGMIMETRDGAIKEFHPVKFLQFLLFMPTISSGPIDRYRRFEKDYDRTLTSEQYTDLLGKGIERLFLGFAYKFIIGYFFGTMWLPQVQRMAMQSRGGFLDLSWPLVGVMYCYSAYLFFDFAGYSLFAMGISNVMGVETPRNFNYPWISRNIKDFWNRWHMTLSFWFRDYIYMRFVFFIMKHRLIKNRVTIANLGYLLLFLIMGIWHGETWYYIVYGIFHATVMILTDAWLRFKKKHKDWFPSNTFTRVMAILMTANTVCFSFLIFSGFLDRLWFH